MYEVCENSIRKFRCRGTQIREYECDITCIRMVITYYLGASHSTYDVCFWIVGGMWVVDVCCEQITFGKRKLATVVLIYFNALLYDLHIADEKQ